MFITHLKASYYFAKTRPVVLKSITGLQTILLAFLQNSFHFHKEISNVQKLHNCYASTYVLHSTYYFYSFNVSKKFFAMIATLISQVTYGSPTSLSADGHKDIFVTHLKASYYLAKTRPVVVKSNTALQQFCKHFFTQVRFFFKELTDHYF